FEVGLDQLRERESSRDPAFSSKPLELTLERSPRVLFGREPATLDALGATAADSVAVCPEPLAVRPAAREFDCLSLLHHRWGQLLSRVDPLPPRSSIRGDNQLRRLRTYAAFSATVGLTAVDDFGAQFLAPRFVAVDPA